MSVDWSRTAKIAEDYKQQSRTDTKTLPLIYSVGDLPPHPHTECKETAENTYQYFALDVCVYVSFMRG